MSQVRPTTSSEDKSEVIDGKGKPEEEDNDGIAEPEDKEDEDNEDSKKEDKEEKVQVGKHPDYDEDSQ
jgi:hypothetical protein